MAFKSVYSGKMLPGVKIRGIYIGKNMTEVKILDQMKFLTRFNRNHIISHNMATIKT